MFTHTYRTILRRPRKYLPAGRAEASRRIAAAGDDASIRLKFGNGADADRRR